MVKNKPVEGEVVNRDQKSKSNATGFKIDNIWTLLIIVAVVIGLTWLAQLLVGVAALILKVAIFVIAVLFLIAATRTLFIGRK